MSLVSILMSEGYSSQVAHEEALAAAESTLDVLRQNATEPADLADVTATRLADTATMYENQRAKAMELLALPADLQAAMGVDVFRQEMAVTRCNEWITAIRTIQEQSNA